MIKAKEIVVLLLVTIFSFIYMINFFSLKDIWNKIIISQIDESYTLDVDSVIIEGMVETDGNPWKITAGKILMEDESSCVFLTPNTSALVDIESKSFCIYYCIHPWVKEYSDGAGLIVWLLNEQNEILYFGNLKIGLIILYCLKYLQFVKTAK